MTWMMPNWISLLIWVVFSAISGTLEAFYYSYLRRNKKPKFKYDHQLFTIIRGLVAIPLLWFTFGYSWMFIVGGFLFVFAFSFFHNGMLYQVGHWLDGVYKKGFFDKATGKRAFFDFDFIQRLLMFLFSLLILLL